MNSRAPQEGVNKLQFYHDKFGVDRVNAMVPMMTKRFADVGIKYSLGGMTGNTLSSHRLSTYALAIGGEELQDKVMEQLMKAYFSDEKFLNDRSVLMEAATEAGVPNPESVIDDPNAYLAETLKEMTTYGRGVSGVPHFIVDGQYKMGGAQPPEIFSELFTQISEEAEE